LAVHDGRETRNSKGEASAVARENPRVSAISTAEGRRV
jgi:hypothetical protein